MNQDDEYYNQSADVKKSIDDEFIGFLEYFKDMFSDNKNMKSVL